MFMRGDCHKASGKESDLNSGVPLARGQLLKYRHTIIWHLANFHMDDKSCQLNRSMQHHLL